MRRPLFILFIIAGAIALYLVVPNWPTPQPASALHDDGLARRLLAQRQFRWSTYDIANGHLHFRENSWAARTQRALAQATDSARTTSLQLLEMQDTMPIEVFFVDTRREMQQLVGSPIGGMVQPGERTAILVYNERYIPFLAHELTHLYTHFNWGGPAGRWMSEGIAAWVSGPCQGRDVGSLTKGMHDAGELATWRDLIAQFDRLDEVPANLQAASMIGFLIEKQGIAFVRGLWTSGDWNSIYALESEWRGRVEQTPKSARLDLARLQERGCWEPDVR
jgi:hypothetical protein